MRKTIFARCCSHRYNFDAKVNLEAHRSIVLYPRKIGCKVSRKLIQARAVRPPSTKKEHGGNDMVIKNVQGIDFYALETDNNKIFAEYSQGSTASAISVATRLQRANDIIKLQ